MSAACTVGSMYCSNAGFTNLLYCLMMPLMSRPRCEMSLFSRRIRRMSESVSTNTFMSNSWQTGRENENINGIHLGLLDLGCFFFSPPISQRFPVSWNANVHLLDVGWHRHIARIMWLNLLVFLTKIQYSSCISQYTI